MILSDHDLKARLQSGSIVVSPLDDPDQQIQPASIDLRLGSVFYSLRRDEYRTVPEGSTYVLNPGEFALASTVERVSVPSDLVARVEGRSSLGRIALIVHATAGFIDPGFEGEITLELSNLGPRALLLRPGSRICQIVFQTMTSPADRPYGPARGSKYHGQTGPTLSRFEGSSG